MAGQHGKKAQISLSGQWEPRCAPGEGQAPTETPLGQPKRAAGTQPRRKCWRQWETRAWERASKTERNSPDRGLPCAFRLCGLADRVSRRQLDASSTQTSRNHGTE